MLESSTTPPAVLHMLAHQLRWQLMQLLTVSDYRVQELVEKLQQPYNLVSYHLKMLRSAGMVALRKSDADGRDLYYSLSLASLQDQYLAAGQAIHPGLIGTAALQPLSKPMRVLFLCTHNSARSQMAEGLLRKLGGGMITVASAGSHPQVVHPQAIRAMRELGVDISQQTARPIAEVQNEPFDLVITVCDKMRETCPTLPSCQAQIHWSIPDPLWVKGEEEQQRAFAETALELKARIGAWLQRIGEEN